MNKIFAPLFSLLILWGSFAHSTKKDIEFSNLPKDVVTHISNYLTDSEKAPLRQASKQTRRIVDNACSYRVKKLLKSYQDPSFTDILSVDLPVEVVPCFKIRYIHNILKSEIQTQYFEKGGYLAVPQGALIDGYLSRNYKQIPLFKYLKTRPEETKKLFKALFNKDIPENKYDLALHFLTACVPCNHIYVGKESELKENELKMKLFVNSLVEKVSGNKTKYFLFGIDDASVLNNDEGQHVIVLNQSNRQGVEELENVFPDRMVILNADQKVLSFPNPPKNIEHLFLTNGNNQCTSVGKKFFFQYKYLTELSSKGLFKLKTIKDYFLEGCTGLTTFTPTGWSNLKTVGFSLLYVCTGLTTFTPTGWSNLKTIGVQ